MDVKSKLALIVALVYLLVSCASQPSGSDEDLAATEESPVSDTNADPAAESASADSQPADEFGEAPLETPAEDPQQQASEPNSEFNEPPADQAQTDLNQQTAPEPQQEPVPQEQPVQESLVEQAPPPQEPMVQTPISESAPVNQAVTIKGIQFKANDSGGSLIVDANGPFTYTTRKNSELNQLVIEIPNSNVLPKVLRPLNMKEFKGGIASVDTYQNPGTQITRVVIQLRGGASDPFIQMEGSSLVVATNETAAATNQVVNTNEIDSATQASAQQPETRSTVAQNSAMSSSSGMPLGHENIAEFLEKNTKFYGEIIDCNFDDMETKEVINLLASSVDLNLITEEVPASKVSISLNRVAWDQCLTVIMKIKKLGYSKIGNILRIASLQVLSTELNDKVKEFNDRKQIDPTRVRIFPISFAEGTDLQEKMKIFLTKDRGSISFDARTNSMIVIDTEDVLSKIDIMIRNLDTPPAQVLIEGKIVEANETFQKQIGVNWGFSGQPVSLSKKVDLTPSFSLGKPSGTSEYGFGLNIGVLDVLGNLAATLALLEKEEKVKVLSSPRVVSINNNKATISAKNDVKNAVVDNSGKLTEGSTMSTALSLEVTPQITNDGSVKMNIKVSRSYPGIASNAALPASAPKFERNVETNVLVKNGQTSVIGGIFQNDTAEGEVGISGLKDIPILGYLFRQKNTARTNTELLVFLTPKILTYNDIEAVKQ